MATSGWAVRVDFQGVMWYRENDSDDWYRFERADDGGPYRVYGEPDFTNADKELTIARSE